MTSGSSRSNKRSTSDPTSPHTFNSIPNTLEALMLLETCFMWVNFPHDCPVALSFKPCHSWLFRSRYITFCSYVDLWQKDNFWCGRRILHYNDSVSVVSSVSIFIYLLLSLNVKLMSDLLSWNGNVVETEVEGKFIGMVGKAKRHDKDKVQLKMVKFLGD